MEKGLKQTHQTPSDIDAHGTPVLAHVQVKVWEWVYAHPTRVIV